MLHYENCSDVMAIGLSSSCWFETDVLYIPGVLGLGPRKNCYMTIVFSFYYGTYFSSRAFLELCLHVLCRVLSIFH